MDIEALSRLLEGINFSKSNETLFQSVRKIVYAGYGEEWWNSPFRIDDFEMSDNQVRLVVSDRTLQIKFRYSRKLTVTEHSKLELVA
jgi:hypothetical protein